MLDFEKRIYVLLLVVYLDNAETPRLGIVLAEGPITFLTAACNFKCFLKARSRKSSYITGTQAYIFPPVNSSAILFILF